MSARCYLPPGWDESGRAWGFAAHLYALRSERNWGMGDFTDLHDFARLARRLGADYVGINPLHALHWLDPDAASPYSPSSRRFLNPFYIDVEAVPEYASDRTRHAEALAPYAADLAAARNAPRVEYGLVGRVKRAALESLYAVFMERATPARSRAFATFCAAAGPALDRFARYEALNERYARNDGRIRGWQTWPQSYRDPRGGTVSRFARRARERVDFYKYVQFLAHEQLAAVAEDQLAAALYLDLAVGVDGNSADVWSERDLYMLDRTVGAPPDPLGPQGQNWGLAPFDPAALEREGGRAFAALLHDAMRYAAALRIDHVMSLLRLFHIPLGADAAQGSYVAYPFELLLSLLSGASNAARCVVIGEDLGTVPDGFRDRMAEAAVLSYRLLLFERDDAGGFQAPSAYPRLALATATTHDLPTLPGWALGRDLEVRAVLGDMDAAGLGTARALRRLEATRLLEALQAAGALDGDAVERLHRRIDAGDAEPAAFAELVSGAYRFLAASPARLVLIQLDDVLGEIDQVNLPGTYAEYPNWRRKSRVKLEDLANDERIAQLAAEVGARVRGGSVA